MSKVINETEAKYAINISFETITLPPFEDILILSHRCPQGKLGVSKCINLMSPDDFELFPIDHEMVEAIIVNHKILRKISIEKIIETLKIRVFPFVTYGEIIKVDFKVSISWSNIIIGND
jgi:hypothetical protein